MGARPAEIDGARRLHVRRLGAERARRLGRRRLQRLGRPRARRCDRSGRAGCGRRSSRASARARSTSSRCTRGSARRSRRPIRSRWRPSCRRRPASVTSHFGRYTLARHRLDGSRAASDARSLDRPMSIYEVHAGSWRRNPLEGGRSLHLARARRRAGALRQGDGLHARRADAGDGASVRRIVGLSGHGLLRADAAGYGIARRFPGVRRRVPLCTASACILDWVPGHFPKDAHGLARFDGTALYEHEDPRQGEHTRLGHADLQLRPARGAQLPARPTRSIWLESFHIDGLRVDAVASMLYLDYSRKAGEWVPNRYGGRENLDAIDFLRELNALTHEHAPGHGHDRRGVHGVSRRQPADLGRRARLHVQVEHGVDARHPHLRQQGSGLPPLGAPAPDVLDALRLERELHPAVLARRGRARQGLDDEQGAGRRRGRRPRRCARSTRSCSRTPARSCSSWAPSSASGASGTTTHRSTGTCSSEPLHARPAAVRRAI